MSRIIFHRRFLVVAVAAVFMAGCQSAQTATKNQDGAGSVSSTPTGSSSADAPSPEATAATDNSGTPAKVGAEGFTYENGLKVAVLGIAQGPISDVAAGGKPGDVQLKITVRVTNETKAIFDTALMQIGATAGADGTQLDTVFDLNAGTAGFEGAIPV